MNYIKVAVPDDFDPDTHRLICEIKKSHADYEWSEKTDALQIWKPIYKNILDKGFIGLVDFMGNDQAIVDAARVSYGTGTKRVNEDRGLIRYLFRHAHWTPVEMAEFKFHVKAPIIVFRQWHRHRTAAINEYSARYSVMSDEMYMPDVSVMKPQSRSNKQGREGSLSEQNIEACLLQLQSIYAQCAQAYKYLLGTTKVPDDSLNHRFDLIKQFAMDKIKTLQLTHPDWQPELVTEQMVEDKEAEIFALNGLRTTDSDFWGDDGQGLSRELARLAMPLSTYSEMYWKCDLRNTLNFISLRADAHAQKEIQDYANAMLEMIQPIAPLCVAAFIDYQQQGAKFSRMEMSVVRELYSMTSKSVGQSEIDKLIEEKLISQGSSKREVKEFFGRMENA
jgi:thymidylate synthase (FAD)